MASNGKRILIIVENLPVPFDKRVWNEALTLKEAGYGVSIICPLTPRCKACETEYLKYEKREGISIHRHKLHFEGYSVLSHLLEYAVCFLSELVLTFKVFFTEGFDVIHACNPPDNIFLIGLIFKCFGKKFVFDHHDICPELFTAIYGKKRMLHRLVLLFERLTFMTADISIATNQSYKKIAVGRGKMDPEKVFIVRSGPCIEKLNPVTPLEHLKENRRYMVGYAGVIGKQEGLDYLLRAVKYIKESKKRDDILFVIIGSGPELENVKKYSKELELEDSVRFTERIPDKELIEYLSSCDVCVNSDVANEMNDKSTMNKIMEYMALKKPIVQFDLREGRVSAQEASLYARKNDEIDMAEKILELLGDPERRKEMGEYGRKRIENELAWKYSKKPLIQTYEELFGT